MPRSPSDATRFTATGPYISTKPLSPSSPSSFPSTSSAKPSTTGTQLNFDASAPANETAQQKIARLRAAAALAKRGQESTFDTSVRIGRIWADRAHRVTALGLIGLTVISGAVATAGITDMLLHNRRRRNEWLAEKQAETAHQLSLARQAAAEGTITEDQMLLINRERAKEEAELAKKNRPGMFKQATGWLFSGLLDEEKKGGRLGSGLVKDESSSAANQNSPAVVQQVQSVAHAVEDRLDDRRRQGEAFETLLRPAGGPLDQQAQLVADTASSTVSSWTSWITRR